MTHLVVGTAGHIDHGKSSLVRALTGTDPDRLKEEKARGITIDLGFAHWQRGDVGVAFVDVPGHERFVKNMLAGVGGIDAVLLVIAADEGVMPQTREHFEICRLLGIAHGVVALTKADLVDDDMIELVKLEAAELLAGSPLASAAMCAVSSATGEGLEVLGGALAALAGAVRARDDQATPRLPVDRAFSMRGFGTVVTGTLVRGRVRLEQELELTPGGRRVKIRGVQVHGAAVPEVRAGQRAALNLAGVEVGDVSRGQVLVAPGALPPRMVIDATVSVLPSAAALVHGARVRFHEGTAEVLSRVSIVGPARGQTAAEIKPGDTGFVRLRLESPAAITRGDRFVLRRYSPATTIAGGQILDPAPPRGGVRSPATTARLARLDAPLRGEGSEEHALQVFIEEAGPGGIAVGDLIARGGAGASAGRAAVDRLSASPDVWAVDDRLLMRTWMATLADRLLAAIDAHHQAQPLSDGVPREELRERVLGDAHAAVAAAAIEALIAAGTLKGRDRIARAAHGVSLSAEEDADRTRLVEACRAAGLAPDPTQVAASTGLSPTTIAAMTQLLVRQKVLVKVDAFVFHREVLERLKDEVRALKGSGEAAVDVASFKERYGLTRRFAIPLLEYLDRERVTRRVGDRRVVL